MNRFSDKKKSSGSSVASNTDIPKLHYQPNKYEKSVDHTDNYELYGAEESYTLGKRYNGQDLRNVKAPWKRSGDCRPKIIQIIHGWVCGVEGCFV